MDSGRELYWRLTYMNFTTAPWRLGQRAPISELPFYEVAGAINSTAECTRFRCGSIKKEKRIFESRISAAY